jgi:glycosyltransferase involved in cell wall biosynthesis
MIKRAEHSLNNPGKAMKDTKIRVLHIDSEKGWRGGQQQAAYLFEKMHRLGCKTAMVCKPGSAMEKYCQVNDLPCHIIPMRGELDFSAGIKIAAIGREHGFDILHLHTAHAIATGLWAKLFKSDFHLIAVRRVIGHIRKNFLSRYKYANHRIDRIVCISDAIRRVLVEDGLPEDRLITIHSGIDVKRFSHDVNKESLKRELGIPEQDIVVGTVAAFTAEKGYSVLLEAASRVIACLPNVTFCAVGTGQDEVDIHAMAEKLNLGHRFVFTGFRNDIGSILKCFDVFVLASLHEGLGTSILDAQAIGLPVVASRTGGIPEIVQAGINGELVPPGDPDALSKALEKMVVDENRRKKYGENAKRTVELFSIETTVEKNFELYRNILGLSK